VGPAAYACSGYRPVVRPSRLPDAVVFAPATAAELARLAWGLAEGPALESALSGSRAYVVALELDGETARHPAVRENVRRVRAAGGWVLEPVDGKMARPGAVAAAVFGGLGGPLSGKKVLVTAGGTREPLDSVRFIGNRSSGKMGLALARQALGSGAEVSVVAANVGEPEPGVEWVEVETVYEMERETLRLAAEADILIMAAAVSDFTPVGVGPGKVRRREGLKVEFESTPDILAGVRGRYPDLYVVGFAATFGDPAPDARDKLERKGADMLVGNDISRQGIGFGADENEVVIVTREGERAVSRTSKEEVARAILDVLTAETSAKGRLS
jgi:phosphopantothenoylcysteine decarboxylase/phosphopantothenate--cysteine ligase